MVRQNLLKGFAAATAAPMTLAGFVAIAFAISSPSPALALFAFLPGAIALAGLISVVVVLVLGIPAHWFLGRLGYSSLRTYVGVGLFIALVPFTLVAWDYQLFGNYVGGNFGYAFLTLLIVSGPLAAFSFWIVVRPDWRNREIASTNADASLQPEDASEAP